MNFIGTVDFQLARDPIWSGGGYELDMATVPWQGAITGRDGFMNGLTRFSTLSGYAKMYLIRWYSDDEPHLPTVTLEYQGCKNGSVPPAYGADGRTLQSITTTVTASAGTYSGEKVTLALGFYAMQTVWTWYSLTLPADTPLYATVRRTNNPLDNTIRESFSNEDGPIPSIDTGTYTQLKNTLVAVDEVQEYHVDEIVPSALWRCTATVARTLQPI